MEKSEIEPEIDTLSFPLSPEFRLHVSANGSVWRIEKLSGEEWGLFGHGEILDSDEELLSMQKKLVVPVPGPALKLSLAVTRARAAISG